MNKPSTKVAEISPRQSLLVRIADRYHVDADKMKATLKATAFRSKSSEITDEQLMMLLVVSDQYKLNPFTAELFAFPSSERGLVPIVSIDGWIRIVNEHPQLASFAFDYDEAGEWIECAITRKDRGEPVKVREYLIECKRNTGPWNSHPQRMLRHKAFIQCARLAFGFAGIYDQDEGERIIESTVGKPATDAPKPRAALPSYSEVPVADLRKKLDAAGVPETDFCHKFTCDSIESLALDQVQPALDWLANVHAG